VDISTQRPNANGDDYQEKEGLSRTVQIHGDAGRKLLPMRTWLVFHNMHKEVGKKRWSRFYRPERLTVHSGFPESRSFWKTTPQRLRSSRLLQWAAMSRCYSERMTACPAVATSYLNLSDSGTVCTGSMRWPESASVAAISDWERGFYESAFTRANVGQSEAGIAPLIPSLAFKR
jgi:hypothetical protein